MHGGKIESREHVDIMTILLSVYLWWQYAALFSLTELKLLATFRPLSFSSKHYNECYRNLQELESGRSLCV